MGCLNPDYGNTTTASCINEASEPWNHSARRTNIATALCHYTFWMAEVVLNIHDQQSRHARIELLYSFHVASALA
jgi:hypothetical protein